MSRRSGRRRKTWHRDLAVRDLAWDQDPYGDRVISVLAPLPRPVALAARREVYPYPFPMQKRLRSRVIRRSLRRSSVPMVMAKVRIQVPRRLPLARGSYVSIDRNRLNVHSARQLRRLLLRGEYNRRRYEERKSNRRKARHGQIDSPGAMGFGSVSEAYRRGFSVNRIADAALVARAVLKGGV